jgi:TonB family protein
LLAPAQLTINSHIRMSTDRIIAIALIFSVVMHIAGAGLAALVFSASRTASQSAPLKSFQVSLEQIESKYSDSTETGNEIGPAEQPERETRAELEKKAVPQTVDKANAVTRSKPQNKPDARQKPKRKKTSKPIQRQKRIASSPNQAEVKTAAASVMAESQKIDYYSLLQAHIESRKYYPRRALKMGIEGDVEVSFVLQVNGEAIDIRSTGGHRLLNQAAIKSIRQAMPLPAPPATLNLPLVVTFSMQYDLTR